jgi:gamma-glutamyltranspeptidase/glutathione hydrolase
MSFVNPSRFTTRPEIAGTFGVVASTHWIATAVGMGVLERGGNAFDAGIATMFALQVVEPHLNGPGGDVPIMVHAAGKGRTEVICGQGVAPAGLTIAHCRGLGLDLVPGTGLLAPCVPGTFDAYMLLLRDYGTWRLRDVLEAAIHYARHGYPLVERIVATIATVEQLFREHWPTSAAVYLPGGERPKAGSIFANPAMADTYERILREAEAGGGGREAEIERARRVWSQGFVAEAIDAFCRTQEVMDVSGRRHRGVLAGEDMARWQASVEAPAQYDYGRYTVQKPGAWCQGIATLQQLALLKGFALDGLDPAGPDFIHLQVEAAKLAFADRDTFLGDPDHVAVPLDHMLSDAYNDARRALIGASASHELRPGVIPGHGGSVQARAAQGARVAVSATGAGEPTVGAISARQGPLESVAPNGVTRGDTVHVDVIDRHGNMMAATPSGGWLQSSPVIPALGFCLGTRAQMFMARRYASRRARAGTAAAHDAVADLGAARWQGLARLGLARRRPAGPVDPADVPASRPCRHEPAGGDRRAGLAHRTFPRLVLAAHLAARRDRRRRARAGCDHRGTAPARPYRRDRAGLVGRPARRLREGRRALEGRRQSARHARLRSGPLKHAR